MGRMYAIPIDALSVPATNPIDLVELTAAATVSCVIHGWDIGQSSDYGDAQAEGLRLQFVRGHTTSGSGGAAATPVALLQGAVAASSAAEVGNTTIASAGTAVLPYVSAWNVQAGSPVILPPELRISLSPSSRGVLRLPAGPTDGITLSGVLWFEEI